MDPTKDDCAAPLQKDAEHVTRLRAEGGRADGRPYSQEVYI
jgi:hypothetical protein